MNTIPLLSFMVTTENKPCQYVRWWPPVAELARLEEGREMSFPITSVTNLHGAARRDSETHDPV